MFQLPYEATVKKPLFKLVFAAPLIALAFAANASSSTDALREVLKAKYPTTSFNEVNETPMKGIYELVAGHNIFYTDETANYLFFGSMYDMANSRDITQERKDSLTRIDFSALDLKDAIKEVKGDGSRVFAVFTDPDCPFCKQLEGTLAEMTDITVYRFLYPLTSLHPNADKIAAKVWCGSNDDATRLAALENYMTKGVQPEGDGACETPLARNQAVGQKFNIRGTPTLIAADGRTLPGAANRTRLEAWLSGQSAKSVSIAN